MKELIQESNKLTTEELSVLIKITEVAQIQGKDARFIADLIDKLIKSVKDND